MNKLLVPAIVVTLVACSMAPALAANEAASAPGAPSTPARDFGGDHFVLGGAPRVEQPVSGDLFVAGGNVEVDAPVSGDAVAVGGNLRLAGTVGRNVYAAGGRLVIEAPVGQNLRLAGGQIELRPKATVAGNLSVFGGQITLRSAVKGSVQVGGGRVLIDAPVDGDVMGGAGQLELGPNARIGGKLSYRSGNTLIRDPAAQVAGAVEQLAVPMGASAPVPKRDRHMEREGRSRFALAGGSMIWSLGLMLLAAVLVAALPATALRVAGTWRSRFGASLLWGLIVLMCWPVAALLLLITLIGAPVALAAMLLYPVLLLLGYVSSGVAAGQWALQRVKPEAAAQPKWRIGFAAVGVLALAVLAWVPLLGMLVALLAVLAGLGAMALQFQRGTEATPQAAA